MNRLCAILIFLTLTLPGFALDYSRFEENGKVGLKDNVGNVVLPASFDALGWSDGNFSLIGQITGYRKDNHWGLLNLKKEFITPAIFEKLTTPGGDRVIASRLVKPFTIKTGCLDLHGKVVIPFIYDDIKLYDLRAVVMVKQETQYLYGLIDINGNAILPLQYKKIEPLGSLRFVVQDFENKSALCNDAGKCITGFTIDHISDFQFDLAVIHQDWKCGILDRNGEIKIDPSYREIKITGPSLITARKADEWRIVNIRQETLRKVESDEVTFGFNGWNRVRLNGRWGFIDNNFAIRWPFSYDYLSANKDNHVVARKDGKYKLLRMDQSEVIPGAFDSLCVQGNFVRTLQKELGRSSWSLYDTFGIKKTKTEYELIDRFNGKFFPAMKRGYWGTINRYGQEQVACVYDSIFGGQDDLIGVKFNGQYGIITIDDEWKVPPQGIKAIPIGADRYLEKKSGTTFLKDFQGNIIYFTENRIEPFGTALYEQLPDGTIKEINYLGQIVQRVAPVARPEEQLQFHESEGLTGIRRDGKFGFVDSRGRLRIANRYEDIRDFHEGLAGAKLLGKWGFINASDQIVIQPTYDTVESFFKEVAVVSRNGKFGLIDKDDKVLLEVRYDSIKKISNNFFMITQGPRQGLVDHRGRMLIEPRFEYINVVGLKWVVVKQNNFYGLLTTDGMSLLPMQYSDLFYYGGEGEFLVHLPSTWEQVEIK